MAPPPKRRFVQSTEIRKAKHDEAMRFWSDQPLDDIQEVTKETSDSRKRMMVDWEDYFKRLNIDPDEIWLDLCYNKDNAKDLARAFLTEYVQESQDATVVLGPEERIEQRSVTSALSLLGVWRSLVAVADRTVLARLRKLEPFHNPAWRLKWMDNTSRKGSGAVFEVSKVRLSSPCFLPLYISLLISAL